MANIEIITALKEVALANKKYIDLKTEDIIIPEEFGAIGDGITDDTESLKAALKYCIDNKKTLYIQNKYYITDTLLSDADYSDVITVNIKGHVPNMYDSYIIDEYGGIKSLNGIQIFKNLNIRGSIENIMFAQTTRQNSGCIFYNCTLKAFRFESCTVSNYGAFLYESSLREVSEILRSRFLTVYYFAKKDGSANQPVADQANCTDSIISYNYINGGTELNDNSCFEWNYYNGSSITNNFIDYYRIIYYPFSSYENASSSAPISYNNQYQVFKYFFYRDKQNRKMANININSNNDVFNWTDETKLEKLRTYTPLKYIGHDGIEREIPSFITYTDEVGIISIKNAILQNNIGNVAWVYQPLTNYNYSINESSFFGDTTKKSRGYDTFVTHADSFYNNGQYQNNLIDINFTKEYAELPSDSDINAVWSNYYLGERIKVKNNLYRLVSKYNANTLKWKKVWVEEFIQNNQSGSSTIDSDELDRMLKEVFGDE